MERPLDRLERKAAGPDPDGGSAGAEGKPIGRRAMLGILGLGGLGVVFGSRAQTEVSRVFQSLHGEAVSALLPGGGGFVLYTVTGGYPRTPADYRLRVDGMVERPLTLSLSDLQALPATQLTRDFQCVTGWRVNAVHWTGVRLSDLVRSAGPLPGARAYRFTSFDGVYTESLTLKQAEQTGAIVAYSMLGGPVSQEHGGPVRVYVPEMFGYKSIKWLSGITLSGAVRPGYWEQNGYPVDAWIAGHPPSRAA